MAAEVAEWDVASILCIFLSSFPRAPVMVRFGWP